MAIYPGMLRILWSLALMIFAPVAQATAVLNPIVVIEPGAREAAVRIINDRAIAMTYRISIVNRRDLGGGQFEEATNSQPQDHFAADFLRFSPRQVTLEPGKLQAIRILVTRPPSLPSGEYKSYLKVEEIPTPEATDALSGGGASAVAIYMIQMMPITVKQP